MTELKPTTYRRIVWYGTSVFFGAILVVFGIDKGLFKNPDTRVFEISVFFGSWLAGVLLLRPFLRNIEGSTLRDVMSRKPGKKD